MSHFSVQVNQLKFPTISSTGKSDSLMAANFDTRAFSDTALPPNSLMRQLCYILCRANSSSLQKRLIMSICISILRRGRVVPPSSVFYCGRPWGKNVIFTRGIWRLLCDLLIQDFLHWLEGARQI